ncbi:DUF3883 domain-containing protein [Rhodococcoides kroppenstedtii]|uniref:DUF3883 domain-containing protein n=1 Tax=Rhodococcoides kroppenstedtii TaxID=293050 RepID=UPI0036284AAD
MSKAQDELLQFDANYMLFLNSVESATLVDGNLRQFSVERGPLNDGLTKITVSTREVAEDWVLLEQNDVTVAFSADEDGPVPLRSEQGLVHAFLPTNEQTGFHVRLNADFSTDPSRTRIVLDQRTSELVETIADVVAGAIYDMLARPGQKYAGGILASLTPSVDEITLQLGRRNFASDMIRAVTLRLAALKHKFILPPQWMNAADASRIAPPDGTVSFPAVEGLSEDAKNRISRMAAIPRMGVDHVLAQMSTGNLQLSLEGYADVFAHLATSPAALEFRLGISSEGGLAIDELRTSAAELLQGDTARAQEFRQLLSSKGADIGSLRRRLGIVSEGGRESHELGSTEFCIDPLGPSEPPFRGLDSAINGASEKAINVKISTSSNASAWRAAELIVMDLMKELGYSVSDHSRQNIGYDILAKGPTGDLFVEVKAITYAGQAFALTPNEESFARDSGNRYVVALVHRALDAVNIQFIPDARNTLQYIKQCRQWVWECSEYEFIPTHRLPNNE